MVIKSSLHTNLKGTWKKCFDLNNILLSIIKLFKSFFTEIFEIVTLNTLLQ